MLYITIKKNFNYKFSYIIVLMNSKRRILKKVGTFVFNYFLNVSILNVDFFYLFFLMKNGVYFSKKFYMVLKNYVNGYKL